MPDQTLEILIKTEADLAAAKAWQKSTEDMIAKVKELGGDTTQLEASLKKLDAGIEAHAAASHAATDGLTGLEGAMQQQLPAHQQLGGAVDNTTDKTDKLGFSQRRLRVLITEMTGASPQLAYALSMLQSPALGLAFAIGAAAESSEQLLATWRKQDAEGPPDLADTVKMFDDVREALYGAAAEADNYYRELDKIENRQATPRENSDEAIEGIRAKGKAATDLARANYEQLGAALEAAEEMGAISHQQYIAAKLNLDRNYAAARIALEDQVEQAVIARRRHELADYQNQSRVAGSVIPGAQDAAGAAAAALKKTEDQLAEARARLEADKKVKADLQQTIADLQAAAHEPFAATDIALMVGLAADPGHPQTLERQREVNEANLSNNAAAILRLEAQAAAQKKISDEREAKVKQLEESQKEAETKINELTRQIPVDQRTANDATASRRGVQAVDDATAGIKAGGVIAADGGANAASASEQAVTGHRDSSDQVALNLQTLIAGQQAQIAVLKLHGATASDLLDITTKLAQEVKDLAERVKYLKTHMGTQ